LGLRCTDSAADGLVCADAGWLPFPDNSFDLVSSVAAIEHFLDPTRVVAELHRVVRPEGVIWICIHLFTSLSGAHNIGSVGIPLRRVPRGVAAWDHLRQRHLPLTVPLNRWRRADYLDAIGSQFQILRDYCATREGEGLLTPALEQELGDYDPAELTCAAYVIVARKSAASHGRSVTDARS
jgi:SAM-dependent methyltransferase